MSSFFCSSKTLHSQTPIHEEKKKNKVIKNIPTANVVRFVSMNSDELDIFRESKTLRNQGPIQEQINNIPYN